MESFTPRWALAADLYVGLESWQSEHPYENLLRLVWDDFDHYNSLLDDGFQQDEIFRVREALLAAWNMRGRFGTDPAIPHSIYVAVWPRQEVHSNILKMMKIAVADIPHIGADDGFFDIYPNTFSMLEQMVFNIRESSVLGPDLRDSMISHFIMVKQIAFAMRYSNREHWELINASDNEYHTMQSWLRRGWLVPMEGDLFRPYLFTDSFWSHIGLAPVKELTA